MRLRQPEQSRLAQTVEQLVEPCNDVVRTEMCIRDRDYLLRQQLPKRVDKIAVLVLVKIAQQALVQRFFVQRRLEINLYTCLLYTSRCV